MALSKHEIDGVKLYIVNNPYTRNIEELSRLTGYNERSVRKVLAALNITRSTKPKHCKG